MKRTSRLVFLMAHADAREKIEEGAKESYRALFCNAVSLFWDLRQKSFDISHDYYLRQQGDDLDFTMLTPVTVQGKVNERKVAETTNLYYQMIFRDRRKK